MGVIMADLWYVQLAGKNQGPFPLGQVQAMAAKGQIREDTPVCEAGGQQWIAAGQLPGLSFPEQGLPKWVWALPAVVFLLAVGAIYFVVSSSNERQTKWAIEQFLAKVEKSENAIESADAEDLTTAEAELKQALAEKDLPPGAHRKKAAAVLKRIAEKKAELATANVLSEANKAIDNGAVARAIALLEAHQKSASDQRCQSLLKAARRSVSKTEALKSLMDLTEEQFQAFATSGQVSSSMPDNLANTWNSTLTSQLSVARKKRLERATAEAAAVLKSKGYAVIRGEPNADFFDLRVPDTDMQNVISFGRMQDGHLHGTWVTILAKPTALNSGVNRETLRGVPILALSFDNNSFETVGGTTFVIDAVDTSNRWICEKATYSANGLAGGALNCMRGGIKCDRTFVNKKTSFTYLFWVNPRAYHNRPDQKFYEESFKPPNGRRAAVIRMQITPEPTSEHPRLYTFARSEGGKAHGDRLSFEKRLELSPLPNRWTFVAMVVDGESNSQTMWIDDTATPVHFPMPHVDGQNIDAFVGRDFDGLIDEFFIFDRALSDSEIASVRKVGQAGLSLNNVSQHRLQYSVAVISHWNGGKRDGVWASFADNEPRMLIEYKDGKQHGWQWPLHTDPNASLQEFAYGEPLSTTREDSVAPPDREAARLISQLKDHIGFAVSVAIPELENVNALKPNSLAQQIRQGVTLSQQRMQTLLARRQRLAAGKADYNAATSEAAQRALKKDVQEFVFGSDSHRNNNHTWFFGLVICSNLRKLHEKGQLTASRINEVLRQEYSHKQVGEKVNSKTEAIAAMEEFVSRYGALAENELTARWMWNESKLRLQEAGEDVKSLVDDANTLLASLQKQRTEANRVAQNAKAEQLSKEAKTRMEQYALSIQDETTKRYLTGALAVVGSVAAHWKDDRVHNTPELQSQVHEFLSVPAVVRQGNNLVSIGGAFRYSRKNKRTGRDEYITLKDIWALSLDLWEKEQAEKLER